MIEAVDTGDKIVTVQDWNIPDSWKLLSQESTALQRKIFWGLIFLFTLTAFLTMPFGKIALSASPSYLVAMYLTTACFDLVTAIILFNQFRSNPNLSILFLAGAYFYSALLLIPAILSFPGAFTEHGLLHAGTQTSAWLYSFWNVGFFLLICCYLLVDNRNDKQVSDRQASTLVKLAVILIPLLVVALTFISVHASELLPAVFNSHGVRTPFYRHVVAPIVMLLGFIALMGVVFVRRGRTISRLFLSIAVLASFLNVFLNWFSGGRFTLGWYVAIFSSFVSSIVLLIFLLYEIHQIYCLLEDLHWR
jgi:hypothetical protein